LTILTCYATVLVVICLNLQACVRLFKSDTNWLVPTEHASEVARSISDRQRSIAIKLHCITLIMCKASL